MSEPNKDTEVMVLTGREFIVAGTMFTIKPFVLRKRTQVLKSIFDIFASVAANPELKNVPNAEIFGQLIMLAGDKLIDIYCLVLDGKDKDWILDNLTIPDEVKLTKIIWEINEFPLLQSQIQPLIEGLIKKYRPSLSS